LPGLLCVTAKLQHEQIGDVAAKTNAGGDKHDETIDINQIWVEYALDGLSEEPDKQDPDDEDTG
jgi:hypothetical protein